MYRHLPQVGELLARPEMNDLVREHSRAAVLGAVRDALAALRDQISRGEQTERTLQFELSRLQEHVAHALQKRSRHRLQRVINATGVILQTNLGRAPLSDAAIEQIAAIARGYCNLEFDLEAGERGSRGAYAEQLLLQMLGADTRQRAALVVNNCAAAMFLALNSLADGGEVIVSRGELVEIGGGFRVPEILRKSGARLVEVGTTNRTRLEDYAAAINADTRLILSVHRSNFEIVGFTEQPQLSDLIQLGAEAGLPVVVDQGTGCVVALEEHGLARQSSFLDASNSGAALVCASGDKLLGGPQCGLIVGEQGVIRKLRTNPLYRALRVDKLTLAALEATLLAYLSGRAQALPTVEMLGLGAESIRARCETWAVALQSEWMDTEVVPTESVVGGGTTPGATLPSFAVALLVRDMSADNLAALLRTLDPPVIARIHDDRVLLDLRTVSINDDSHLASMRDQLHAKLVMALNPPADRPR
ncbi:MAG TPA: L-seryl-tRNA(Sec) selenium transferase [Terracidiphilus sp.]